MNFNVYWHGSTVGVHFTSLRPCHMVRTIHYSRTSKLVLLCEISSDSPSIHAPFYTCITAFHAKRWTYHQIIEMVWWTIYSHPSYSAIRALTGWAVKIHNCLALLQVFDDCRRFGFIGGDDRGFLNQGVKTYRMAPMSPTFYLSSHL
jgi:hypothetical protein